MPQSVATPVRGRWGQRPARTEHKPLREVTSSGVRLSVHRIDLAQYLHRETVGVASFCSGV